MTDKTQEMKTAVQELYFWARGRGSSSPPSNFTAKLYDLIAKADTLNKLKIAKGFPAEVSAYNEWMHSKTEVEFFKRYGL